MLKKLLLLAGLTLLLYPSYAQVKEYRGGDLIHGKFLGESLPLIEFSNPIGEDDPAGEKPVEAVKNFDSRKNYGPITHNPNKQIDPVYEGLSVPKRAVTRYPSVLLDGLSGNTQPPDPSGAAGPGQFLEIAHFTRYRLYDSLGNVLIGATQTNALWSQFGLTGCGDPIVMYDKEAGRWFISEFACQGNVLLIAISSNSDAGGTYYSYEFNTPNFPDYPKYGIWHDAYYCTTNESTSTLYAMERDSMIVGASARMIRRTVPSLGGFGFQTLTPSDWDGTEPDQSLPATAWRHVDDEAHSPGTADPTKDYVEYWEFTPNFNNPGSSLLSGPERIDVAEFDSDINGYFAFSGIIQPHPSISLDPLREVFMQKLQFRDMGSYDVMMGAHVTDVDGNDWAGMRWYEFRKYDTTDWIVHQQGTYAPDLANRWMGCVSMDKHGNIALAYNVASSTIFPSLRYTGRLAGDPLGTMTMEEQEISTGFANNPSIRYGDYSAISINPSDDETFWFIGEFNPASAWSTGIAKFKLGYDCNALYATGGLIRDNVCADTNIAEIAIAGTGGFGSYEYSIDNVNWQSNGLFTNVPGGTYRLLVRDADSTHCVVSIPGVQVADIPQIVVIAQTVDPSSATSFDGQVTLQAFNSTNYTYSLDGVNYQTDNLFTGLNVGSYVGYVRDGKGCVGVDSFELKVATGLQGTQNSNLNIYPNPNDGSFWIELQGGIEQELEALSLFHLDGRKLEDLDLRQGKRLRVNDLMPGLYLLVGKDQNQRTVFTERIVVNN